MRNLIAGGCGVEGTRSHGTGRLARAPALLAELPPHGTGQTSAEHVSQVAICTGPTKFTPCGRGRAYSLPIGSMAQSGSRGRAAYSQHRYNGDVVSQAARERTCNDIVRTAPRQRAHTREDVLRPRQYSLSTPRLSEFAKEIMGSVMQHHFFWTVRASTYDRQRTRSQVASCTKNRCGRQR
jgi:hypothetical protein